MDDKQFALLIFKAIRALEIDVPIMSVVLVGDDRVRLGLYGGRVVEYPPGVGPAPTPSHLTPEPVPRPPFHLSPDPSPKGKGGKEHRGDKEPRAGKKAK